MTILNNLKLVNERIKKSCAISSIDLSKVKILAVSKKMGTNKIFEAHEAGLSIFGENYVSESYRKNKLFKNMGLNFEWHYIGPIQSNKTKSIAENFDWVHSVRIRELLKDSCSTTHWIRPLNIFVQVNSATKKTIWAKADELSLF